MSDWTSKRRLRSRSTKLNCFQSGAHNRHRPKVTLPKVSLQQINEGDNMDTLKEQRMIAAHRLGIEDYHAGREPIVPPVFLSDENERDAYRAGYQGAAKRDVKS
jgi:hypothetical protein